jgi:uncharacterized repeat protein (TIGR01451 family)
MRKLGRFSRSRSRRFWASGAALLVVAVVALVFVAASSALTGSPSGFESNDGNMTLDTSGNTDWNCFQGANGFATLASGTPVGCDVTSGAAQLTADAGAEITWVNGQKFDTQCPALETGNVPGKDDFTHVASYGEIASNNDAFFYGAAIRATANGDSSGDVEFNQSSTGDGVTTAGCRTAGDLLLGYDFSNGGTVLNFKVLTWIDNSNPGVSDKLGGNNGTCFVSQDSMPCWGANLLQPASSSAEGLTNQAAILAADNGISGTALAAQQFAEFGVNLTQALGLGATCESFPQLVWESRTSGSSFTSNPEDIEIEHKTINTCAQPTLTTKLSADSILNTDSVTDTATVAGATSDASGAITISVYSGSDANACVPGNLVTSKTASPATNGNGDYSASFSNLAAGSYEFQASIAKDAKNLSAVSACGTEPLTVMNQPTIATALSESTGSIGDTVHDSSALTGATSDAGGSVTYTVYSDNACTQQFADGGTKTVTNGVVPDSNGVQFNAVGTYYWQASYTGDDKNKPATSPCTSEQLVINVANIHIAKTADAAKVNVGSPIGFTMTVWNNGAGTAHDVTLTDTLPTNPGLSWTIASQGSGWGQNGCSISSGVLTCGPADVPAGTTQADSTFTVHITSTTTGATGGDCPGSGTVDNTGKVTASNASPGQSSASTCVQALVDLSITKAGSPATQDLGQGNITWTIAVTNNGPSADTGVTIADPMPAGNTFVSATSTKGSCTGGAILNCTIGDMAAGESVTITLVTTPSAAGAQTNTVTVAGNRPETNTANNQATATVQVTAPFVPPPVYCVAVSKVTPNQLFVGRKTKLTIRVTKHGAAVKGVHVQIKGPKFSKRTGASNARGVITQTVKLKKAGILVFSPIASKRCNTKRVGVTGVFTPPVTG